MTQHVGIIGEKEECGGRKLICANCLVLGHDVVSWEAATSKPHNVCVCVSIVNNWYINNIIRNGLIMKVKR